MTSTESLTDQQLTYAERINKLLRKAESTDSSHEAEALTAKAQELMSRWGLDEALLAQLNGKNTDGIEQIQLPFTGTLGRSWRKIPIAMAKPNNLKAVVMDYTYAKPHRFEVELTGFKSDLERVRILSASVQIQAVRVLKAWEKERGYTFSGLSAFEKFRERRQFIESFAYALGARLQRSFEESMRAAARERAAETKDTTENEFAGMALAIRTRRDQVKEWADAQYGDSLTTSRSRSTAGSMAAHTAGTIAGRNADVGSTTGVGANSNRALR